MAEREEMEDEGWALFETFRRLILKMYVWYLVPLYHFQPTIFLMDGNLSDFFTHF